jgi:hypothetical protein
MSSIASDAFGEIALRSAMRRSDEAQRLAVALGGDAVVDAGVPGGIVLDTAAHVDAGEPERAQRAADVVETNELDEQIGGEVAAGDDHVLGELAHRHRLADHGVHFRVGITADGDAKRFAVHDAVEPVAHVHAGMRLERTAVDGGIHAEEDGNLDGARGMEPAFAMHGPRGIVLEVVDGHRYSFGTAQFCE